MGLLSSILRGARGVRVRPRYYPFSTPRYRGRYPLQSAAQRVNFYNTNALESGLTTYTPLALLRRPASKSTLSLYEDRRLWHPLGKNAFPKSKTQSYPSITDRQIWPSWPQDPMDPYHPMRDPFHRIRTEPYRYKGPLKIPKGHDYFVGDNPNQGLGITRSSPISWENPYDMIVCLKRKIRREIMNALGLAGKTGFKKPKYTQFSYVRCR